MDIRDCLLGLYEKALPFSLNWDEKLGAAKELSYDCTELSIDPDHTDRLDWSDADVAVLRGKCLNYGIPFHTMALSANRVWPLGMKDDKGREFGKTLLKKAVVLSQKLGIRVLQIATYDVYEEEGDAETDRLFLDSMRECVRAAARNGVMLALETMDKPYANGVKSCKRIVDEIASPWLRIYADTGNIASAGYDFETDIRGDVSNIVAFHLKDSRPGVVRRVDYGTGIVVFDEVFAALNKHAYSGLFVAEMWGDGDPLYMEKARDACLFLRSKIEEACL